MRNKFIDNIDYFVTKIEKIVYIMYRSKNKIFIYYRTHNKIKLLNFYICANIINLFFISFENIDYKRNVKDLFRRF